MCQYEQELIFCEDFGFTKGVLPLVPDVPIRVLYFLVREEIHMWTEILTPNGCRYMFWIPYQQWGRRPVGACNQPILELFLNAWATGVDRGGGG